MNGFPGIVFLIVFIQDSPPPHSISDELESQESALGETDVSQVMSQLSEFALPYNNCRVTGQLKQFTRGKLDEGFSYRLAEFSQLMNESRVVLYDRVSDDDKVFDEYRVASPDISFIAQKFHGGEQVIHQLSARRGMDYDAVRASGIEVRSLCLHSFAAFGEPLPKLFNEGRLRVESARSVSTEHGLTTVLKAVIQIPGETRPILDFEAEIQLLATDGRVVSMKTILLDPNGEKGPYEKLVRVKYRSDAAGAIPETVHVETIDRNSGEPVILYELSNIVTEFGTVVPADFTLEGCGITVVSTTGASRPIIVWYVLNVGILGAVAYFLVRRYRAKAEKTGPQ